MAEQVHFLPVGFDFDRLVRPITKGEMKADRVVLLIHEGEPNDGPVNRAARLAADMGEKIERTLDLLDIEVNKRRIDVDDIYDYATLYPKAHDYILTEIKKGNDVYVNISSMPRTVSFAFATAADSLITERQEEIEDIRHRLHTYYVAPKEYLVLDMIDVLESVSDTLDELKDREEIRVYEDYQNIQNVLERVNESGVSEGARDDLESGMYVEFPTSPSSDIEAFEEVVLRFISEEGYFASTSELAQRLARQLQDEYDASFRSRVQYNVSKLDRKGYVSRIEVGNRMETGLSTMGELWVETHKQ